MINFDEINWQCDKEYSKYINKSIRILIVAGPSGSGKSTLVEYLSLNSNFRMVDLYTTRKNRKNAIEENIISISSETFLEMKSNKEFFLSRTGNTPYYGYKKVDIENIIDNNKIPVFMFRQHGVEFLVNFIYNMRVIFISGNPCEIIKHSQSMTPKFSESDIENVLIKNIQLKEKLNKLQIQTETIFNNYNNNFFEDIEKLKVLDDEKHNKFKFTKDTK